MVADPMRGPLTFAPGSPASGCAALARFTYVCFLGMEPRGRDAPGSMFAGVIVASRPRRVRGLNESWPRGSKYSPRRGKAANKEKAAQALRVKVRECSRMYRPPNPPEKFKTNLSVWLARLKPPRTIWRLCSPHCSPEINPVDAIARAVLGSVCLLDEFPECLARS